MKSSGKNNTTTTTTTTTSTGIFNVCEPTTYNYEIKNPISGSGMASTYSSASVSTLNENTNNNNNGGAKFNGSNGGGGNQAEYAEIQAQLELAVELNKFINIDLFQRGFYQIRVGVVAGNKAFATRILVQLEKNANNNNLSETMFPSCVINEQAVSKTFLILYKNEEIILDDQIIFKISSLLNVFNIIESFEKLDLQVSIELWFTENDYKPGQSLASSLAELVNASQKEPAVTSNNTTTNGTNENGSTNTTDASSGMTQLCARTFKLKFDLRHGLHVQIPVVFDYFHLSAVVVTLHSSLLTLLPPVMLGTNAQRNITLSSILYGQDFTQLKNTSQITQEMVDRAVFLHDQICALLLAAYESLQEHIIKANSYLTEFEQAKLKLEFEDCRKKMETLKGTISKCSDAEEIDDMANRHVAQCSAENIMLWCLHLERFSFNTTVNQCLAAEYHIKRVRRFSEAFFARDITRTQLIDFEPTENYATLNDLVRQSAYFQALPGLSVACDELDGTPEQMPVIFEENYTTVISGEHNNHHVHHNHNRYHTNVSEYSNSSGGGSSSKSSSVKAKQKFKKKSLSKSSAFLEAAIVDSINAKPAITLVSYKKKDDDESAAIALGSSRSADLRLNPRHLAYKNHLERLSAIKADLNRSLDTASLTSSSNTASTDLPPQPPTRHKKDTLSLSSSQAILPLEKDAISLDESVSDGVEGLDLSGTSKTAAQVDGSKSEDVVPTDFSVKSRALYESFRGKTNTLERKQQMQNKGHHFSDSVSSSNHRRESGDERTARRNSEVFMSHSVSFNNAFNENENGCGVASSTDSLSFSYNSGLSRQRQQQQVDLERLRRMESISGSQSSVVAAKGLATVSTEQQVVQSSSGLAGVSEILFKFVIAREELKKLLAAKYHGNIYSEFSSVFCSAPYFYPNLTPKQPRALADPNAATLGGGGGGHPTKKNTKSPKNSFTRKFSRSTKSLRDSFMSTLSSKAKVYKQADNNTHSNNNNNNNNTKSTDYTSDYVTNTTDEAAYKSSLDHDEGVLDDEDDESEEDEEQVHLVVCVHGLEGNSGDLRLVRTYLELALPGAKLDFLMSNLENTFDDVENMAGALVTEILSHLDTYGIRPGRISFIGHSLGNLIIRTAVCHKNFEPLRSRLYTYLSLSGPHLGTLYNTSGLVNMGLWLMQKWKKSGSLLQLALKDHADLRKTFLYELSKRPTLECFKNILLVASLQDRYVPFHSARVEMCKAANRDTTVCGSVYREMVLNCLKPILADPSITFKRFCAFYTLPGGTTSNLIGRAAHIAVLDSELFVEKFVLVSVAKHFR